MSKPLKFELDVDDFEVIHRCINSTLMTSTTVRVPKAALEALLRDHGMLLRSLHVLVRCFLAWRRSQSGGWVAQAARRYVHHNESGGSTPNSVQKLQMALHAKANEALLRDHGMLLRSLQSGGSIPNSVQKLQMALHAKAG